MTPILGLIIAVIAAQLAPNARALLTATLSLILAATAVQSWDLGAGLGSNPPSTIREASYWIVQAAIIAITLAVAYGCFALRRRKASKRGTSLLRPSFTGRRGILATSVIGALMTVVGIAYCLIAGSMHIHYGRGGGNIPWTGVAGMSAGLLLLVALSIAFVRDRHSDHDGRTPTPHGPVRRPPAQ